MRVLHQSHAFAQRTHLKRGFYSRFIFLSPFSSASLANAAGLRMRFVQASSQVRQYINQRANQHLDYNVAGSAFHELVSIFSLCASRVLRH